MTVRSVSSPWLLTPSLLAALCLTFVASACGDDDDNGGNDTGTDIVDDTSGDTGMDVVDDTVDDTALDTSTDTVEDTADDTTTDTATDTTDTVEDTTPTCDLECGDCETCELVEGTPTCVFLCRDCQACEDVEGTLECVSTCEDGFACGADVCVRAGDHAGFPELAGPFATGPSVTAACIDCHEDEAAAFIETPHWNFAGATPGMVGHESDTTVGKRNLINNFCIATDSNEARCNQCHTGYGWRDDTFDFDDTSNIDCLVCHADPASGYARGVTTAGVPDPSVDLLLAAQSVGETSRQNCGSCHFYAGGGDNVKLGDMGSALANPTTDVDVHMGGGMDCSSCHAGGDHTILGSGVHLPVSDGPLACTDCHDEPPHASATLNEHTLDIACQTCHIPAFSRQQPTKMDWDWSTAGNRTRGTGGVETATIEGGAVVRVYDFMKGDFVWEQNVRPSYAWYDGRAFRMTLSDTYPEGQGTDENPVDLGSPVATIEDGSALIYPFKVMRGQQPAQPVERFIIVPHLFGPGGFWPGIPAVDAYTPEAVRTLWTNALTAGAIAAGQIEAGESFGEDDWDWVYTEMYLGINHEVAPADLALGAGGCGDCHSETGALDFEALGYLCDPATDPEACGSRHIP